MSRNLGFITVPPEPEVTIFKHHIFGYWSIHQLLLLPHYFFGRYFLMWPNIKPWLNPALPPPPLNVFKVRICSFPLLKAPPIWGLPIFPNPPFAGISRAFPALETPLNQEKCSMYPPKFGIISQESKEMREKKKKHPLFKEISGWKVKYTPFFTILGPDFVARKVPLYRTFWQHACGHSDLWVGWGGGGGGGGRGVTKNSQLNTYTDFWIGNLFIPYYCSTKLLT